MTALPSALSASNDWQWSVFWLVCPFLTLALLLGVIALVALFRAPRTDATQVLIIFVSAFRHLADRLPRQEAPVQPELDTEPVTRQAGEVAVGEGERS